MVMLGSQRTELPDQSRYGSYSVEVCAEAGEHEQDHDEGRCTSVLRCLLQHKKYLLIMCQFPEISGEGPIEEYSYPAGRCGADHFRITDVIVLFKL